MFSAILPDAARLVVWAIVLGGVVVFIYRRIKGIPLSGRKKEEPTSPSGLVPSGPLGVGDPARPPASSPAPPAGLLPSLDPSASDALPIAPSPALDGPPSPPSAATTTPTPAPIPAAPGPGPSGLGGFFGGDVGVDRASSAPDPGAGRPTVAEAVQGIEMPAGLSPVIDGSESIPNPFRVSFLTTTASAPEVGRDLAAELRRLGFTLTTSTATELLARRGGIDLRVVLFPSAGTATRGLDPMFPAAPAGAVGVELST